LLLLLWWWGGGVHRDKLKNENRLDFYHFHYFLIF
jgi:hypothetical protein